MNTAQRKNLKGTSNAFRELLGLNTPICLSELKHVLEEEFGIQLVEETGCQPAFISDEPYGYKITYDPTWDEPMQLSCLASVLGKLFMYEQTKDAIPGIYTGTFQLLDATGSIITDDDAIRKSFRNFDTLRNEIERATTVTELLHILCKHANGTPDNMSYLTIAYDFQTDTMINYQMHDNVMYYVKVYKK